MTSSSFRVLLLCLCLGCVQVIVGSTVEDFFRYTSSVDVTQNIFQVEGAITGRQLLSTRLTFTNKHVSDKFCAMDDNGNCHWMEYIEALAVYSLPGAILFLLSFISLIVWLIGRCACNVFGGKHRTPGIFFPGNSEDFYEYSWKSKSSFKIALFVAQAGVIAAFLVSVLGNQKINHGVSRVGNGLIGTGEDLLNTTQIIGDRLIALNYTHDIGEQILQIQQEANSILKQAKQVETQVNTYNSYRSIGLLVLLAVPVAIMLIGSLGAIMDWFKVALGAAIACFVGSMLIWLCFTIHYPTSVAVSDVCTQVDLYMSGEMTSNITVVQQIMKCNDGGGFAQIEQTAESALNKSYGLACGAAAQLCNSSSTSQCPDTCTRENLAQYKDVIVEDYVDGCEDSGSVVCGWTGSCANPVPCPVKNVTLQECATTCNNTNLRDLSEQTVVNMDLLFEYDDIITNEILPLLNCSFVHNAIVEVQAGLCKDFNGGIFEIALASAFMGALFVPATIILIMGFKRFRFGGNKEDVELADLEKPQPIKIQIKHLSPQVDNPKRESNTLDGV